MIMKLFIKIACCGLGLFCIIPALLQVMLSNFNMGTVLAAAVGALLLCGGIFAHKIFYGEHGKIFKAVRALTAIGLCAVLICSLVFFAYGKSDNADYTEDAVIVLGAAVHGHEVSRPLKYRLDKAAEYCEKNPDAIIIVSGGKGYQEEISEAEAMKNYLVNCGIDSEKIIKEESSFGTDENFANSKEILRDIFGDNYTVAVITSDFHVMRSVWTAKQEGLDVSHVGAKIVWYNVPTCYIRECAAFLWYLIK